MPISPQELATLLFESSIPDEVKSAIIHDLLPKMNAQDIYNLYEILKIEQKETHKLKGDFEKSLKLIKHKILEK